IVDQQVAPGVAGQGCGNALGGLRGRAQVGQVDLDLFEFGALRAGVGGQLRVGAAGQGDEPGAGPGQAARQGGADAARGAGQDCDRVGHALASERDGDARRRPGNHTPCFRLAWMKVSRSPSRTFWVLAISTLVRGSLMRLWSSTYERIWWPQPTSVLESSSFCCSAMRLRISSS